MPNLLTQRRILRPFRPDQLQGLALWLDAADLSTITLDSGLVAQWSDKSGNGKNAVQSDSAKRPSGTDSINALNAVGFDGTNDCLTVASLALPVAITIFAVFDQDNATIKGYFMEHGPNAGTSDGFFMLNGNPSLAVRRSTVQNTGTPSTISTIQGTAARVATGMFDTSRATNSEIARLWRDGAELSLTRNSTSQVVSTSLTDTLNIGSRNDGAAVPFDGALGELLIYGRILNDTERTSIESYLKAKWGTP